jgi:DNA-binding transcriptional MerR regulator
MDSFSIRACAAKTGVSPDTLRYYEKIGLLSRVSRSAAGHRQFTEADVRWVTFLRRLHDTGMPIRRMQQYARLLRKGDHTRSDRQALLEAHREDVRGRIAALHENLRMIEKKIRLYAETACGIEPALPAGTSSSREAPTATVGVAPAAAVVGVAPAGRSAVRRARAVRAASAGAPGPRP